MKRLWTEMSADLEKQKTLTDALIIKMTQAGYRDKISKIRIPEMTGALLCGLQIAYILFNIKKLGAWYLEVCAVGAVAILLVLCVLSLRSIRALESVQVSKASYKQSLLAYSKGKIRFVFIQKLSFYLTPLLMLAILPVAVKLFGGKDLFVTTRLWIWYGVAFLLYYPLARWVFRRYIKIVTDAEAILKELEG